MAFKHKDRGNKLCATCLEQPAVNGLHCPACKEAWAKNTATENGTLGGRNSMEGRAPKEYILYDGVGLRWIHPLKRGFRHSPQTYEGKVFES